MKLQKYACRIFAAMLIVVATACVDNDYRIDDVSGEVTLISGKTKLFVGELQNKTLGDLLGDTEVEGLTQDESGNFTYSYSGEGEPETIDGIETSFTVPGVENKFNIVYPSFDLNMQGIVIEEGDDIEVDSGILSQLPTSGTLSSTEASLLPTITGSFNRTYSGDDMHLLLDLPEQVDNIKSITFKDIEIESGHHGAPMHLAVDFNGLAGINGGGKVNFKVGLAGGEFKIVDVNGNVLCEGSEFSEVYDVESGVDKVEFVIYVESVENSAALNDNHQLDLPLALTCDVTFEFDAKAGQFNLSKMPHFSLNADFEFGDAEISMNGDVSLVEYHPEEATKIKINNLPQELKAINCIGLKEGTMLNFYADGLEWLGDNADKVAVEVKLPEYIVLHAVSGAGYEYDEQRHVLSTTIADINDGVDLIIEALDFGAEGLVPDAEGSIMMDLAFDINAHFAKGVNVNVSSLKHDQNLEITTGIDDIELDVKYVSGKVDYTYTIDQEFKIKTEDINIGELEVGGVGLSPVITLNVDNPLTLPLTATCCLADDTGRNLDLGTIMLKAATYDNGRVVPTANKIVVANSKPDYDCTYVEVNFDELLAGTLPSKLSLSLSIGVDSSQTQTLYVADEFAINYDYSISVPVAVNDKLSVYYADEFVGFGEIFTQVAEYDVCVGDIALIAEVANTTPLALVAEAVLLDKEGNEVDLKVELEEGNNRINGSKDGKTEAISTLRLNVANKDGNGLNVVKLAEVDGIAFKVWADSDAEGDVAITKEQYVGAKLWLELDGGITINYDDFI